jgi:hypothetical protein
MLYLHAHLKIARKAGIGCCLHASAANATGWTPLTASLRWRPLIIVGANTMASGVLVVRGVVAYCREVKRERVQLHQLTTNLKIFFSFLKVFFHSFMVA